MDGPTPDIDKLGGVDLARDGTGGLVYLKRVDGAPHVFLSRFNGGQFRAPERVDNGIGAGASEAAIAAADAGRLAIVWIAGSRVYGSVVAGSGQQPGPLLGPTELYNDPSGPVSDVAIDMGINGAAYATWAGPGGGGADVRVARLMDVTWTLVGAPLDIDPAQAAGRGSQRSRVAVSAEGNAVVAWGENHADGRPRVYMRRVTGTEPRPRSRRSSRSTTSAARSAGARTRPTSTSRTTARSPGPSSARTSGAARARSRGGCWAPPSTRACRSTAGRARARRGSA